MKKVLSAITILSISIGLLGCGKNFSLSANASEDEQINCPKVNKCSFVSLAEKYDEEEEEWYFDSSIFRHNMKYDLNDFYRHNDNYEAIYRTYKNVKGNSANYVTFNVSQSLDGLREQAALLEHYHFIVLDLVEADGLPDGGEQYQTLVFDVETGDYWAGDSSASLYLHGKCIDEEYSADSDLIEYVEGKWPVPEYRTFYEYLCSMDWLQGKEAEDL
ncbi:MAG: hypothetical protein J6O61_13325 [Butyrivibrio sp.]|uniref:hypothetical protein n=1 Tax=Butyrivibrio sp. TaxID=28121 RepID=UPI001B13402D|nr:hypothetical protein [Butyrivibrio sp.]MBO6241801.1 hypothetical protein [Butyrivibrio sp.]